jgi:hypothetical protein
VYARHIYSMYYFAASVESALGAATQPNSIDAIDDSLFRHQIAIQSF